MSIYDVRTFTETAKGNSYVGRGIVVGKSADDRQAVIAYFIMGRSTNSRNRVFRKTEDGIMIEAYDPSKLEDPSLVIYSPVRQYKNNLIVTNGDQTDTIYDMVKGIDSFNVQSGLQRERSKLGFDDNSYAFEAALDKREFEPDGPNFTPRISAMLTYDQYMDFAYKMSILKSMDPEGTECARYTFSYKALPGLGHFIHTYNCDGTPIPTFTGEPERVVIPDDIDAFTKEVWDALDENNRVSLYVQYYNMQDKTTEYRLINRHEL